MSGGEEAPAWASELPDLDTAAKTADKPAWADHLDEPGASTPVVPLGGGHAPPHHPTPPTLFHKAAAPSADPELSWGDVGSGVAKNFIPSGEEALGAIAHSVMHPLKTVESIGQLGTGALSQAAGAIGLKQDPVAKAKDEALLKALEDHYKTAYGSVKGFKKNLATDPVGVAMDASTFLDGAGLVGKAAGLEKTAAAVSKVVPSQVRDALRIAAAPVKAVVNAPASIARGASSIMTKVPTSAMKLATEAGAHPNPAVREAYSRFVTGQGDATEFQQAAQKAVKQIRDEASADYLAKKGPMAQTPVDFTNTQKALSDAYAKAGMGATTGPVPQATMKALDQARDMVNSVANDPARNTLEHADALKQQLWDLKDHHPEVADNYLNGIYHGVRNDLIASDPEYAALMEKYQVARNNITDLTKTLGTGQNAAASATLAKNLRAMKTAQGENLLSQIIKKDPTITGMLAGSALHPWHRGGVSLGEAVAGVGLPLATHNPGAALAAIPAAVIAASPRISGAVNYGAGAASRLAKDKVIPLARPAYYAGRADQENGQAPSPTDASPDDIDLATRMILAEAANQPDLGKAAVMHTALNRARLSGRSLGEIIRAPNAFEGVTNGSAAKFKADSPQYQYVRDHIVIPALSGELEDPSHGATYFLNRDLQKKEGRAIPKWAESDDGQKIGAHTFYARDFHQAGGRVGRATGGRTISHEQRVARLMKMVERAKKGEMENTKPLLKLPDEAVANALHVAQRAI